VGEKTGTGPKGPEPGFSRETQEQKGARGEPPLAIGRPDKRRIRTRVQSGRTQRPRGKMWWGTVQ